MTAQLTELVRESLDQLTDGATVPARLAARARHRVHRRAILQLGAAGTAAVTGAAVLVTALAAPSTPRASGPASARLTAYVVSRVSRALTAADKSAVSEAWLTPTRDGGLKVISWSGPRTARTEIIAASRTVGAGGYVVRHGRYVFVTIDYRNRTWQQRVPLHSIDPTAPGSILGPAPALPATTMPLPDIYATELLPAPFACHQPGSAATPVGAEWSAYLHDLLACHELTVVGRGRVDGAAAFRLATAGVARHSWDSAVLWVNRSSYLPLRLTLLPTPGASGFKIDLRWLPATAANLARTRILPPPAGFRRVA